MRTPLPVGAAIIVSHGEKARIELAGDGELKSVGDITPTVTVAYENGELTKLIAQRATPLFHLSRIRFKLTALEYVFSVLGAMPMESLTPDRASSDPRIAEALEFERVRLGDEDDDLGEDSD